MFRKKTVYLDSSSAILLEKTDLLKELLEAYRVILTEAVYRELTMNSYPSANLFKEKRQESQIEVRPLPGSRFLNQQVKDSLAVMGEGEADTIQQFLLGNGGFIMLDDGQGARFCAKQQIPFINALLFPKILNWANVLSEKEAESKTAEIKRLGRYSEKIIVKAKRLTETDLMRFLP